MEKDAHDLREQLYSVIQHYSELSQMAHKGEVDPISRIGRIVKKTAPYLLLVIRDLLPQLERGDITYYEALYLIIRQAQEFPDVQVLLESRNEIQEIEQNGRVFFYAIKWLDSQTNIRPALHELETVARKLSELNRKYRERYSPGDEETATLIPCFVRREETESGEMNYRRTVDVVRRAILELHHLMVQFEPAKSFYFFTRNTRKEIENDLMELAWFLFRCGMSVDRIASGYYKDLIASFLNEKLLDLLLKGQKNIETMQGLSTHLWTIALIDFASFFEIPADYIELDDLREVHRHVKTMKGRHRRGGELLEKTAELNKIYGSKPQGRLAAYFLRYRYHASFGAYHGEFRQYDVRGEQAVTLYKPLLDSEAMEKKAQSDLVKGGQGFSTKTREEMSGLITLIMDSLADPRRVRGKKVKVLGDISSGAMGKVSIGIFENRIVALKRVKEKVSSALGDPIQLLQYEADVHRTVQSPVQHPSIVEYFGLIEQDGEKLLINSYYPTDNLTQLVERNWLEKYKPPFSTESKLSLSTLEIIINQLLECLKVFRDRGVIHRDLKTDNVLYLLDGEERLNRVKVIDFGVGVVVNGPMEDMFRGKVVGTFSYMAPEQSRGKSLFQSDLYSVGAIFTVLLTGKLPMVFPKTRTRQDLVKQIVRIEQEPRPRLVDLNPFLKKNTTLEHIAVTVDGMLDLDPSRRPTIEEVQDAFSGVFHHIGPEKEKMSIFYHRG